jgi:hypothetical protein
MTPLRRSIARTTGAALGEIAGAMREQAPTAGPVGDVARQVAGGIDRGGSFIIQQADDGVIANVGRLIRQNPVPTALAGVGVLFLALRRLRRK